MVGNVVSRRYAKALIEIVKEDGRLDKVNDELKQVNDIIIGEPKLFNFLGNPAVSVAAKQEALDAIIESAGISELVAKFLNLLLEKDRLKFLNTVLFFYEELSYQIQNRLKVKVTSASPLPDQQREEIIGKLKELTGKQVELTLETDPDLLGGLVAQVGSTIFDGSLKNQLLRIKEELIEA